LHFIYVPDDGLRHSCLVAAFHGRFERSIEGTPFLSISATGKQQ